MKRLDKLVSPVCTGPSEDIVKPTEDWRKWTPLTKVGLFYPDGTGAFFELIGNHSLEQVEDRITERCAIDHHIPDKIVITLYRNGDKNKGENNE